MWEMCRGMSKGMFGSVVIQPGWNDPEEELNPELSKPTGVKAVATSYKKTKEPMVILYIVQNQKKENIRK